MAELCRRNGLSPSTLYRWRRTFISSGRGSFDGTDRASAARRYGKEAADLKRRVWEYAVANAALKRELDEGAE